MTDLKPTRTFDMEKSDIQVHPGDSPPPSYTVNDETVIPDLSALFSNLNLQPSSTPTADQCIAHLKLLEAFHQLRENVALTDGLFGILDAFAPSSSTANERQRIELLTKIREKRWAVYVAKAVKRFERWWEAVIEPNSQRLRQREIPRIFKQKIHAGSVLSFDLDNLPPLG